MDNDGDGDNEDEDDDEDDYDAAKFKPSNKEERVPSFGVVGVVHVVVVIVLVLHGATDLDGTPPQTNRTTS